MRVKAVPVPVERIEDLERVLNAIPLVPEPEESCCERLSSHTEIGSESARDWLTFLGGLELVREGNAGFYRTREEPDPEEALLSGVYGAREVRNVLRESERVLTPKEVFERFEAIPRWERHHHRDPEAVWRERVGRLLGWLVLFGIVDRTETGYVG